MEICKNQKMAVVLLAFSIMLFCHGVMPQLLQQTCSTQPTATIQSGAEAMIAGILSVHDSSDSGYGCGVPSSNMQEYEALRWALNLVNKKNEILNGEYLTDYYVPGIRLGLKVLDYCGSTQSAIAAASQQFPSLASGSHSCVNGNSTMMLGIIGASSSGATEGVASFVDNFSISVISYAASAPALTFSGNFPNFLRTIPPDGNLVLVMSQVMIRLNWKYVVVIYEDATYGRAVYDELRPVLAQAGICLTLAIMASPSDTSESTVSGILRQVLATDTVGTIFLGDTPLALALLQQAGKMGTAGKLQWIFTDSISLASNFANPYPRGIISIAPASRYIVEFEDHWVRIDAENPSPENPWFREWYMNTHNCQLQGVISTARPCSDMYQGMTSAEIERQKRMAFVQDQYVEPAIHAVFSYANALRNAQIAKCGVNASGICQMLASMTHDDFLNNYLKKVDFTYAARERVPSLASDQYAPYYAAKRLKFDVRGDIISPAFSVWNYNDLPIGLGSSGFKFREVGNYFSGRLTLTTDNMRMYNTDRTAPLSPLPSSPCPSDGCSPCLGVIAEPKYVYIDGDVVINGIFSLHGMGTMKLSCSDISKINPLYLEAMIYAVNRVNINGILKNGVKLGALGIDDCMDSVLSVNFITQVQKGQIIVKDASDKVLDPRKVEAYTGGHNAPLTIPLASLMNIFEQPLIGYLATSTTLDDRTMYPYYASVVPSLEDELRAIILILQQLKWNYVQVVFSTDAYDDADVQTFRRLATQAGICVVASHNMEISGERIISMLNGHASVRPVVLLLSFIQHRSFLHSLQVQGLDNQTFRFIATTTFGNLNHVVQSYERVAEGFISINWNMPDLNDFFQNLSTKRLDTYTVNPWFREWYESLYNCTSDGSNTRNYLMQCINTVNTSVTDSPNFVKDLSAGHVINSIYAIAIGLNSLLSRHCGVNYNQVCGAFSTASNKGMDLLNEILRASFQVGEPPSQNFSFNDYSGSVSYNIYNYNFRSFKGVGYVNPQTSTIFLSSNFPPTAAIQPTCPDPCIECLYMFSNQKYWYMDGDLIIPTVFDVHYKGSSAFSCGGLRDKNGVQYTETFKFALDLINNGTLVQLNGVHLGGLAFDGCTSTTRSSAIINGVMGQTLPIEDNSGMMVDPSRLVSWLTYDSESTMQAADLLKMINVPIVSPGATAPQLLDKAKYSTFFRTIPSDSVIVRGMADLVREMGWSYVITLNAPDESSRKSQELFREILTSMGICIISNYEFETDGTTTIILDSIINSTTEIVAVFSEPDQYIKEMLRIKESPKYANLIFVSNRWWNLTQMGRTLPTNVVNRTLAFQHLNPTLEGFMNYLQGLRLETSNNPWLPEYYQALFNCSLDGSLNYASTCSSPTWNLGKRGLTQDIWTLSTINAVHAIALGLSQTLVDKCGSNYRGVCNKFLRDADTMDVLMDKMDIETFQDIASYFFDFIEREVSRPFEVMYYNGNGGSISIGKLTSAGVLTLLRQELDMSVYKLVKSKCTDDCLMCENFEADMKTYSFIDGDIFIVGLFDVHVPGATPFSCGNINDRQGLQLLESFNFAVEYINRKIGLFNSTLKGIRIGAIGIDVCGSPIRAANLVANVHIKPIIRNGVPIDPRRIIAYVGPFDTETTIHVADVLTELGMPQITYGATGLQLMDSDVYGYLLRSVPADDKQSRAIISYLKNFNLTNVQVITSWETIGLKMTEEFMRLAVLNLVCITHSYTVGFTGTITSAEAANVVQMINSNGNQSNVVVLLVDDPFPILQAAGNNAFVRDNFLWVATNKWGFDLEYLDGRLKNLLGNRNQRKNVIIFDVETADVPLFDLYLENKTPDNYLLNPWFKEYYEFLFQCSWNASSTGNTRLCDRTRAIPRAFNYTQDPYVLYVVNAVFSIGLGLDLALKEVCISNGAMFYDGLCPRFEATGNRRDIVLRYIKQVNFTDDTLKPFYYEPTGQSSRGFHIYNITVNPDGTENDIYENVGSYNDTHFLKLDITYNVVYNAHCTPYVDCICKFPEYFPSRYMLQPSPKDLNLVYIGDIHQPSSTNPFLCSSINIGRDFFRMMAFFYAINLVNTDQSLNYPSSLKLGGVALDTCSSTLRLDQDVFNLLSGYPLCETGQATQVIPPSTIVAFIPDGNLNAIPISRLLAPTEISIVSPSATSSALQDILASPNFMTVIPQDDLRATAILELMSSLNWNYASVIYSEDASNIAAMNEFLRQTAVSKSACMGKALGLSLSATVSNAENVLEQVSQQFGARAVILFTTPQHTRLLMEATKNLGLTGRYIWIGVSDWGQNNEVVQGFEQEASGAIIIQPLSILLYDFQTFIKSLTFTNRRNIPDDWFEEIYQTLHKCTIQGSRRPLPYPGLCTKNEVITDSMIPNDSTVLHTVIAVYMVAQGLNGIQSCKGSNLDIAACIITLSNRNQAIYQAIRRAEWNVLPGLLGNKQFTFSFIGDGYGNMGFDILNFHKDDSGSGYVYSSMGTYRDRLVFTSLNYRGLSAYDAGVVPTSSCIGIQCLCQGPVSTSTGASTSATDGKNNNWIYSPKEATVQVTEEGHIYLDPATSQLVYVEKIPSTASRFSDMWGVAVATLAAIGVFVSVALFLYLIVVYPVRGGTSILGYMLAFGIILLYGLVFAFVAHVNTELCGLRRFCLGFFYAFCYSTLFVKLVDCWRSREKEDMFEVKYNKLGRPLGLLMVTFLLVLVQVIINAEWLILEAPKVVRIFYNSQYWPRCTPNDFYDEGLVLSLCYIMVLIFLIIIFGLLSFNSTKNHKEARWILGMAILSVPTWVVWCAWSILGAIKTRDAAVAIGLLINATILFLLGPVRKLYLLNKYQTQIEREERLQQQETKEKKDFSSVYERQYGTDPRLHESGSVLGSTRDSNYQYQQASMRWSGPASYRQ